MTLSQRPGWPSWPAALKAVQRFDEQGRATLAGSAATHWKLAGNSREPLTTLQIIVKTSSSNEGQVCVRCWADCCQPTRQPLTGRSQLAPAAMQDLL